MLFGGNTLPDLISIVVPIYNVEEYLRRCLDSLVSQTYPNLEIILVNDGSKDNCNCICEEYSKKYPHVLYYEKENGGLSDARNYGFERASGKLIGFVDSDDWITADMYQSLASDMKKYNADISTCGFVMVSNFDGTSDLQKSKETEVFSREEAIRHLFDNDKFANFAWNKLYKRELFDGVRFPFGKKMEDLGTTYKLFLKSNKITFNPQKHYKYFQRDNSILHKVTKGFYEDKLQLSLERYKNLRQVYPGMEESVLFFLNTLHECLPYVEPSTALFMDAVGELKEIDNKYIHCLTRNRILKSKLLSTCPKVYMRLFGKKYDN